MNILAGRFISVFVAASRVGQAGSEYLSILTKIDTCGNSVLFWITRGT